PHEKGRQRVLVLPQVGQQLGDGVGGSNATLRLDRNSSLSGLTCVNPAPQASGDFKHKNAKRAVAAVRIRWMVYVIVKLIYPGVPGSATITGCIIGRRIGAEIPTLLTVDGDRVGDGVEVHVREAIWVETIHGIADDVDVEVR